MYDYKTIAVFGVSQDTSKYGYKIFTSLLAQGLSVYGIHPKGGTLNGRPLFTCLVEVPVPVEVAVMVVPPAALAGAVAQCQQAGVKEIWFQPGAREEAAYQMAVRAGIKAINGCFMKENGFW